MAKFIYRMQNILNLKTKLEEQQKMEFAAARKRLDEEEEKLNLLFRRKANYEEEGRRLREDSLNVQDILDNRNALIQMDDYIAFQRIQVSKAEDALEIERQKLQEAVQERKIQEKLRENAFEVFMREENARESKEVDELVSYRFQIREAEACGRKKASEGGKERAEERSKAPCERNSLARGTVR